MFRSLPEKVPTSVQPAGPDRAISTKLGRHSVIIRRMAPDFSQLAIAARSGRVDRITAGRGGLGVHGSSGVTILLFTDIEGSTRLWKQEG